MRRISESLNRSLMGKEVWELNSCNIMSHWASSDRIQAMALMFCTWTNKLHTFDGRESSTHPLRNWDYPWISKPQTFDRKESSMRPLCDPGNPIDALAPCKASVSIVMLCWQWQYAKPASETSSLVSLIFCRFRFQALGRVLLGKNLLCLLQNTKENWTTNAYP